MGGSEQCFVAIRLSVFHYRSLPRLFHSPTNLELQRSSLTIQPGLGKHDARRSIQLREIS